MRVISGKYKGQAIEGFDINGTRPTMSRVKESLMATIQNYIPNSKVLDLFGGSGGIAIEMLSMGAKSAYIVDNNKIAIDTINRNIKKLKITEEVKVIKNDYQKALKSFKETNTKFDIIFLDPPYNLNYINNVLKLIKEYDLLNDEGIIVCEYEKEQVDTNDFTLLKEKTYSSKTVKIYQNK